MREHLPEEVRGEGRRGLRTVDQVIGGLPGRLHAYRATATAAILDEWKARLAARTTPLRRRATARKP